MSKSPAPETPAQHRAPPRKEAPRAPQPAEKPREIGGPSGPEPTRYGDWERNGRCTDF